MRFDLPLMAVRPKSSIIAATSAGWSRCTAYVVGVCYSGFTGVGKAELTGCHRGGWQIHEDNPGFPATDPARTGQLICRQIAIDSSSRKGKAKSPCARGHHSRRCPAGALRLVDPFTDAGEMQSEVIGALQVRKRSVFSRRRAKDGRSG